MKDNKQTIQLNNQSYEFIEEAFWQPGSFDHKRISFIIEHCNNNNIVNNNASYLDVGCNTGLLISLFSEKYSQIFGVEISDTAFNICKKRFLNINNITIIKGDAREIDKLLEDKKFDLITCTDVLEHIPQENVKDVLVKFRTLLKKDGRLIITTPGFFDSISIFLGKSPNHLHAHSSYGWASICIKAGLKIIKIESMEFPIINHEFFRTNLHFFGRCCLIESKLWD